MKKGYVLSVAILVLAISGCGGKKKAKVEPRSNDTEVRSNIDIPMAEDGIKSFFDEDINEFALADDLNAKDFKGDALVASNTDHVAASKNDEFAWEDTAPEATGFKVVYFDFDQYSIRQDQEANLQANIELVKKTIEESKFFGKPTPTVVIDGHACHSAGSRVYNLALSEKRAKVLADQFVAAGVERENIKIVGRGSEMPAIVDGKPCEGNREQQWPNRRDELRILYS